MKAEFFILIGNSVAAVMFFTSAILQTDHELKQTRLLYAIFFSSLVVITLLGRISFHIGALPLSLK